MGAIDDRNGGVSDSSGVTNVLVLSSSVPSEQFFCLDSSTNAPTTDRNVLYVDLEESAERRLERWLEGVDEPPARMKLLCMGDTTRSAAATASPADDPSPSAGTADTGLFETIDDPADLSALGTRMTQVLDAWADTDEQTIVCFDSLGGLFEHADLERAFRFLYVLTYQVETTGAVAQYRMDPTVHDPQTVHTLEPLFDEVVSVEA